MLGIVAVGVVRESRKYSGHPCIGRMGALRGHRCDSTAFLSLLLLRFQRHPRVSDDWTRPAVVGVAEGSGNDIIIDATCSSMLSRLSTFTVVVNCRAKFVSGRHSNTQQCYIVS